MKLTILGHASLFFETTSERVLLDPVLRTTPLLGSLVHQYPRRLDIEQMPRPTLIVITHRHFDHFDPETLARLPKDIPVLVPPDKHMTRVLQELGFGQINRLNTWEALQHGALRLIATPSEAPVVEFGLLVETDGARVWHMSDAEPSSDTATRILSEYGPVDVVTTKFQPADPQLNYQHNMGSSYDRRQVASWLETACACAPKLAFPYASGLCFQAERSWLNRYAYPFSGEYVADLLGKRLGDAGRADIMCPGDVISITRENVVVDRQASSFIKQAEPETRPDWEPFDDRRLLGLASPDDRSAFEQTLEQVLLGDEFAEWLARHSSGDKSLLRRFSAWRVLCQIAVHMGEGKRLYFQIDFSGGKPSVVRGKTAVANYLTHIGADAARRLLAGEESPLGVMIEGSVNISERIITVVDGRLDAPETRRVYKDFPDPLISFGGMRRRGAKAAPELTA